MAPSLRVSQRLPLHVMSWAVVGGVLTLLVHTLLGTDWEPAAIFAVPLTLLATPVSLSARYLCSAMPLSRASALRVAISLAGAAIVTAAMWAAVGQGWWVFLGRWGVALGDAPPWMLAWILLGLGAVAYLFSVAINYLLIAYDDAAEAEARVLRSEIAAREAELRALRAQIDPHFLFNSLNSISALIGADPVRARAMGQLLAEFLRESLMLGAEVRIPIAREVALARRYLEIEHVRFGQRLSIETSVSEEAGRVLVPALMLQPLVENAVRHGIATCLEGGTVEVSARMAGDVAAIAVTNPRDPEAPATSGTGFGLDIVRRRLAVSFGDAAGIIVEPGDASFRVTLTVPVGEQES